MQCERARACARGTCVSSNLTVMHASGSGLRLYLFGATLTSQD